MKIGLIARADLSRGLGSQTHSFYTHLDPYKTLIIDMGDRTPYRQQFELYNGRVLTTTWRQDGSIDIPHINWLLSECDLILTAETFYDPRIITMAADRGIPTVCQANYEFAYWLNNTDLPRPTLFAFPSTWMDHRWPPNSCHLPFPIDTSLFTFRPRSECRHLLHIAGHPTRADRDGTQILLETIPAIRRNIELTITSQQPSFSRTFSGHFTLHIHRGDLPSLTPFYENADVFVMPRRFGGQSLKLNEAVASGLFPIMPACDPQVRFLPAECLVKPIRESHYLRTQAGNVPLYRTRPATLANRIHELVDDPSIIQGAMHKLQSWVQSMSWESLKPVYMDTFNALLR